MSSSRRRNPRPSSSISVARRRSETAAMKVPSPSGNLSVHLEHISLLPIHPFPSSPPSRFQKLLDGDQGPVAPDSEEGVDEKDCILSQDFFCTPDYITPETPQIPNNFEFNKENVACPRSPEKSMGSRNKRHRQGEFTFSNPLCNELTNELQMDAFGSDELDERKSSRTGSLKKHSYVSQSAVALRCRVMPPPCIKNPYLNTDPMADLGIFSDRRTKMNGLSTQVGGDGLSRYRTDFHEIEQIGCGNFSHVFKALKRIDGCMYAVKCSIKQLYHDTERRRALMEVQALAALGSHDNIVGYYSSWFENEKLYIQMELCEQSLLVNRGHSCKGTEVLEVLYQIAKALQFMHGCGIAHLDVKPENIYVKEGAYKLGDFGCATRIDRTLHIEEGDARYMPQEMLNDKYEHLDKVDIFSLGAAIYEVVKGSPLPDSGPHFSNLREGKMSLLPGYSMQFQNLLKVMMDPNPVRRPSAKEITENPIFEKARKTVTN